jgi:hypothetical protein
MQYFQQQAVSDEVREVKLIAAHNIVVADSF